MFRYSHIFILAAVLTLLGLVLTIYQHWDVGLPWDRQAKESTWTIEAKVDFKAKLE